MWDVSPKRIPIDGDSRYELWANRMHKTYFGFLVLTSIVVPIYQSGKVIYVNPESDLLDVSQMGSLKKQPSDNARLCEKSGMENGPHGDLDGCFS